MSVQVEKLEKNDKKTNPLSRIKILVNIKKNYTTTMISPSTFTSI